MVDPNCIECWDKIAHKEAGSELDESTRLCLHCNKLIASVVIEIPETQELIY